MNDSAAKARAGPSLSPHIDPATKNKVPNETPQPNGADDAKIQAESARLGEQELLRRELDIILGKVGRQGAARETVEKSLWGVALSGGGIRSATFSLGVLQALSKKGWLGGFHYLSTVSGGGYIGAYIQGLIVRQEGLNGVREELAEKANGTVRQLRCFSNFLAPDKASFSADRTTFASVYVGNLMLTQLQLIAWLMLFLSAPLCIYVAFAFLANTPRVALAVALVLTVGAMCWRGHLQLKAQMMPQAFNSLPSFSTKAAAGMLICAIYALTAFMLGSDSCRAVDSCALLSMFQDRPGVARILGAVAVYLSGFAAWLFWWLRCERARRRYSQGEVDADVNPHSNAEKERLDRRQRIGRHIAGLLFGVLALTCLIKLPFVMHLPDTMLTQQSGVSLHLWWVLILDVPLVFLALFCCTTLHAGVAFYTAGDRLSRERWSRIMGRCALVVAAVSTAVALTAIGPWAAGWLSHSLSLPGEKWAVPIMSLITSAAGARAAYFEGRPTKKNWLVRQVTSVLISVAPVALVVGVLLLIIMLSQTVTGLLSMNATCLEPYKCLEESLSALDSKLEPRLLGRPVALMLAIWVIGYLLSVVIDENECSMNGFYRNRLVRCYLAPSSKKRRGDPETDQDPARDDILLSGLIQNDGGPRPLYPLICAAANLTQTPELDWQDRRAASFVFSPLHCGYIPTSQRLWAKPLGDVLPSVDRREPEPEGLASTMTLGTAIATSGAAVSPNMGYHSSPPVAFLLTLFNARLGWWVENLNATKQRLVLSRSKLISELLSRTRDSAPHTYVSDGGHFENLGIYELVRRKCRFILCVDASADPDRDFESLGNAIHKCRVDFGASIDIDVSLMQPNDQGVSKRGAVLGRINYGDCRGLLLYIKPSITGGETADITRYSSAHSEFPHEPTHDQFFDEHQFEAYRQLGNVMGDRLFSLGGERWELVRAGRESELPSELTLFSEGLKESLLLRLEHWLFEPSDATALRFAKHGAALCRLLERLRSDARMQALDGQLNAGWEKAGGLAAEQVLPRKQDFRPCFYFIQEVIQLMENVYLDLDLERNFNHPDNRGWMNLFRQWTWVPMFKVVWTLTSQSLGSRFAHFCEEALGAPRVGAALRMDWKTTTDVASLAKDLRTSQRISYIENEILTCDYIRRQCDQAARMDVGLLYVEWDKVFECSGMSGKLDNLDVGLVVAVSMQSGPVTHKDADAPLRKIIVGRVQDHVRRMGFGAQMIFLSLEGERHSIDLVEVAEENYGETIGKPGPETAKRQRDDLNGMLRRARRRYGLAPSRDSAESTSSAVT